MYELEIIVPKWLLLVLKLEKSVQIFLKLDALVKDLVKVVRMIQTMKWLLCPLQQDFVIVVAVLLSHLS